MTGCERAQVVPVFAGGLDFSLPVRKFFYDPLGSGKAYVSAVVSLTGFALVGGPARQDAPKVQASVALQLSSRLGSQVMACACGLFKNCLWVQEISAHVGYKKFPALRTYASSGPCGPRNSRADGWRACL